MGTTAGSQVEVSRAIQSYCSRHGREAQWLVKIRTKVRYQQSVGMVSPLMDRDTAFERETLKGSPEPRRHVNTYGCLPYTAASTNQGRITEAEVWLPE